MKVKTIAVSGIVAALYVVIMAVINPVGFLVNQFRIPEMLNHLIVFNKKYFFGIVIGVFVSNLLFSPILPLDLIVGVGHSIISLVITLVVCRFVKNNIARMIVNTLVFSFNMFLIAIEIIYVYDYAIEKLPATWLSLAISQLLVMAIGIPVMYLINKRVKFNTVIEENEKF